jgi:hypothetical protein
MEGEIREPLFLTFFAELYSQQIFGRVYYKKERNKSFYEKLGYFYYTYIDSILQKEQPHCVLFECFNAAFAIICYQLAVKYGIFCFALMPHYVGFYFAAGRPHNNPLFEYYYKNRSKIEPSVYIAAERFVKELNAVETFAPMYMDFYKPKMNAGIFPKIHRKYRNAFSRVSDICKYALCTREGIVNSFLPNPVQLLIDGHYARRRNRTYLMHILSRPAPQDKYFIYFVAMQPEVSTSAQAPFYAKQEYIIENVSISMPAGYLLYVKEHPADVGRRGASFYGRFKYYPNIKIVEPSLSSKELVQRSEGVITIAGGIGFEALLLDHVKPVIMFGDAFYDSQKGIEKVTDFRRLPDLFREIASGRYDKQPLREEKIAMAAAYLHSVYEGRAGCVLKGFMEEENIASVAQSIDGFVELLDSSDASEYLREYWWRR